MSGKIDFGLLVSFTFPLTEIQSFKDYAEIVTNAEELGFDAAFFNDHFVPFPTPQPTKVFDCWTLMSALAPLTYKIRLGSMVSSIGYRHPSVLAKIGTTMDHVSNGRLIFGIGAGWYIEEYFMHGITYPKAGERIEQLKEAVEYIKNLWTQDNSRYVGKHFKLEDAIHEPKPLQKPWPPIWIGGKGEKKTLRVVAQHADASNFGGSPEDVKRLNGILDNYCKEYGRKPQEILRTTVLLMHVAKNEERAIKKARTYKNKHPRNEVKMKLWEEYASDRLIGTPEQCVEKISEYIEAGMQYCVLIVPDMYDYTTLSLIGDEILNLF